jgi:glycerol-3-phosphate O-acyltransferase
MTPEFTLPEFTRSLRALAVPSAPGSDHDVIFAPLLEARRAAHRATSLEQQVAAFEAGKLERAWRGAIASLAERRHGESLPDRRALGAELELLAAPVWAALTALKTDAERLKLAKGDQRHAAWEQWIAALHAVFRAADAWWERALPVLADSRGRQGGFWRRVLRRSK